MGAFLHDFCTDYFSATINYAKNKKIDYEIIKPRKRKTVKKSYADNFLK